MRKRQGGQAFILVLILLAIGALLVVPALRLTGTSLKSSQIVPRQTKALYAVEAAQEWVLWKLKQPGFTSSFQEDVPQTFQFDACGVPVDVTVIMRAVEGTGGITLATDDIIRPTKTVECEELGSEIPNDWSGTVTYTIRLEQLSGDTTQGLDAVYDILPKTLEASDYKRDSSYLSVDGGPWESIPDPLIEEVGGQVRLRWPASGNFASPMRDFAVRQVKEIRFEVVHDFRGDDKDSVLCNWVLLKVGDTNTLSGPTAPITVGSPADPGVCKENGLLQVSKTSDPEVILPGVPTPVTYTITITNLDGFTHMIQEITDYLPPEFYYSDNSTSGITNLEPQRSLENINDVDRQVLRWTVDEFPGGHAVSIAASENLTLTFWVDTTKDVSGSYYNEVTVIPSTPIPPIFNPEDMDVTYDDFNTTFSWNTGAVMVPAYDSEVEAEGVIIAANMALVVDGVTISSWQVK